MELISNNLNIPFMKYRFIWAGISLLVIAFSLFTWNQRGSEKYGVDFTGGTEIVVRFKEDVDIGALRSAVEGAGFRGVTVQSFENKSNEYSVRLKSDESGETPKKIRDTFQSIQGNSFEVLKEDFVGPVIGEQIRMDGFKAILFSVIAMLIYIAFRFELSFGIGGIVALVHDVIITGGIYLATGHEINGAFLAAVLTILGYSINDTIIVYDRIRENLAKTTKKTAEGKRGKGDKMVELSDVINSSINQTLSRTILTSLVTSFVVATLWYFGGGAVADLNFALLVGIIVGTYSSIFIASPVVLSWHRYRG